MVSLTKEQELFVSALVDRMGPSVASMVDSYCQSRMGSVPMVPATTAAAAQMASTPSFQQAYPGGPSFPAGPGFIPSQMGSWCNIKCDPCLFSNLALDVELYSWPLIEPQLYDVDTKLNNVVVGAFPLSAGNSVTISQELDRTIAYIPDCVQIATTWTGTPQPGLLSYQWQITRSDSLLSGAQQFGNIENGQQYECGTNCIKVPFPSYKGCSGWPIGSLSSLQLVASLSSTATSTLTGMMIAVYHKRSKKINNCGGGCDLRSGSCGGGCGG